VIVIIALSPATSHNCCQEVLFMPILMLALIALGAFAAIGILLAMAVILERKEKVIAEKKAPAAGEI
jgi:hypothetical protein